MGIITKCEKHNRFLDSDIGKDGVCYVEPCPDCLKIAEDKGYKEGYKDGMRDYADGSP